MYENAFTLITTVFEKLCSLDSYDVVVLEGLFRYESIITQYVDYFASDLVVFEMDLALDELLSRDKARGFKGRDLDLVRDDINASRVCDVVIGLTVSDVIERVFKVYNSTNK